MMLGFAYLGVEGLPMHDERGITPQNWRWIIHDEAQAHLHFSIKHLGDSQELLKNVWHFESEAFEVACAQLSYVQAEH